MRRLGLATLVAFLVLGLSQPASAGYRADNLLRWTNEVRTPNVRMAQYLTNLARTQTSKMLEAGSLSHSTLSCVCGEVVGVTTKGHLREMFNAFMASRAHRSIILDPRYRRVGIGVRVQHDVDGYSLVWVTMVFA